MGNHKEHAHLIKMGPQVSKQIHEQENPCHLQHKKDKGVKHSILPLQFTIIRTKKLDGHDKF